MSGKSSKPISLIYGISGQVGSFLAEELLNRGHDVHGILRRTSSYNTKRIDHIFDKLKLHHGDVTDTSSIYEVVGSLKPTYLFNLSALSHVAISFSTPLVCNEITGTGVLNILEAVRKYSPHTKFVQSSSSEIFGGMKNEAITEKTEHHPRSPYGCSKQFGYAITVNYRESYNLFASNLIMFNCESERRGKNFVTAKVVDAACRIKLGLQNKLVLGNPDSSRDWGFCGDYVDAFIRVAEANQSGDYIVASEETHTIREFVEIVFLKLDMDYKDYVEFNNPQYIRPAEVSYLLGDASKIKRELLWEKKTSFDQLVNRMVEYGMKEAEQEKLIKGIR